MRQIGVFLAVGLLVSGPVLADEDQVARGAALAERWCTGCHVIGPDVPGGDVGPSFVAVADRIGQSAGEIEAWLADPHPPMPDMGLGATEYRDLAAYIFSLAP